MSKFVKIASPLFANEGARDDPSGRELVLREIRKHFESIRGLGVDLIVFSEGVEAVGQTMDQAESFDDPGAILNAYSEFAKTERCHVAGSVKFKDDKGIHNSIAYIDDEGSPLGVYHKVFLTQGELEAGLVPGQGGVVVDSKIGRLGGAICFDLNFPELRRQYQSKRLDLITFASMYHGGLAQGIWAYECQSFLVSALPFHGGGVVNPHGAVVAATDCYNAVAMATVNLDRIMVHLDFNREKFLEMQRQYGDQITLAIPPNIGSAILYSNSDSRTAMDIATEYELEILDDYLRRMRTENEKRRGNER